MKYDKNWVFEEHKKRNWMSKNSLYREETEHASCGVGLVVSLDGQPSRKVVENGIEALKAVWHRGAVDADGKTGDGAGIHIQIPVPFFYDQIRRTGHEPRLDELIAVGQVFLPRTDFGAQETCRTIVERPKFFVWDITYMDGGMFLLTLNVSEKKRMQLGLKLSKYLFLTQKGSMK